MKRMIPAVNIGVRYCLEKKAMTRMTLLWSGHWELKRHVDSGVSAYTTLECPVCVIMPTPFQVPESHKQQDSCITNPSTFIPTPYYFSTHERVSSNDMFIHLRLPTHSFMMFSFSDSSFESYACSSII